MRRMIEIKAGKRPAARFLLVVVFLLAGMGGVPPVSAGAGDGGADMAVADNWRAGMDSLLRDELLQTSQLGLCVYDLTADTLLYAFQSRQRMRPASTEKVVTAVSALAELGQSYKFSTRLYHTGEVRGGILQGDLYVVGGFDPCFGEADLAVFVEAVKRLGVDSIAGRLCADVSMKDTLQWGWGWCWDDEMPVLTPLPLGGEDVFMERMSDVLDEAGIWVVAGGRSRCPAGAVLLAERVRPLSEVLRPMMKESDNLCAEAVFYQLAARSGKPYASRKEALHCIERLIGQMGYDPSKYLVADGSGVSLYNYLTPELEVAFLRYAYRDSWLFQALYEVLPVAGVDGTLKRRMREGRARDNVRAKTGTLEGVSTLAGYALASNNHALAFCIMNQGVESVREAQRFQDRVCEWLCR